MASRRFGRVATLRRSLFARRFTIGASTTSATKVPDTQSTMRSPLTRTDPKSNRARTREQRGGGSAANNLHCV